MRYVCDFVKEIRKVEMEGERSGGSAGGTCVPAPRFQLAAAVGAQRSRGLGLAVGARMARHGPARLQEGPPPAGPRGQPVLRLCPTAAGGPGRAGPCPGAAGTFSIWTARSPGLGAERGARRGAQCGQSLPAAAAPGQQPEPAPAAAGKTQGARSEPPPPPPPVRTRGWGPRGPLLGRGQPCPPLCPPGVGGGGAAPAARFARGPPSCPRRGSKNMTASSWSGMPWDGLGRLHLSKERSQGVEKGLFKPGSSFLQLATTCPDLPSDISRFLREGPDLLLRWLRRGGGFGS
ncbi:uncharacterized protein LOC141928546 [Strix aluco]|uniref:uncharacterized protein LOC141928546 n=1 Tax=Strix aluco TaxID=111821 RepID=UPI003DA2F0D9